jgi:uncharacterized protein (DUF39 family)
MMVNEAGNSITMGVAVPTKILREALLATQARRLRIALGKIPVKSCVI